MWATILIGVLAMALVSAVPAVAQDDQTNQSDDAADQGDGRVKLSIDVGDNDDDGIEIRIDDHHSADYVRFGDDIHVGPDEHITGDVVAIGGEIIVEGKVSGDCVAVGGSIVLETGAEVTGEVVCVGGTLTLGDSSRVGRDAVSVWGGLEKSPTAYVGGNLSEVQGPIFEFPNYIFGYGGMGYDLWEFFTRLIWVLILGGLGIVAFHIFPSRMARLAETADRRGLVSFLAGLAGWILWLPVFVLLCITVVGIPVGILFIFLTPIMTLLGYIGVARVTGAKIGRTGTASGVFFGVLTLEGALLLGHLFGVFGSIFELLGLILSVVGCSVIFVAGTMGFGAFLITRFRPEEAPAVGTAPPPPAPHYGSPRPSAGPPPPPPPGVPPTSMPGG
jgi:hypothetical protein